MKLRCVVVLCGVALTCAGQAWAEGTAAASTLAGSEQFDMESSLLRMVGGLLFCLGLFAGGVQLYRRFCLGVSGGATQRRLRIIERVPLTQKGSLLLVALDGREFVLATGPDATSLVFSQPRNPCFDEELLDNSLNDGDIHA
jgi:flagellar biogenesis protein FliO